jgi:hypothetical protein
MSSRCLCIEEFPPRKFQKLRDADEFHTRIRFSTLFMQIDHDGLRYGCRRCGTLWAWKLSAEPPFLWRHEAQRAGLGLDGRAGRA